MITLWLFDMLTPLPRSIRDTAIISWCHRWKANRRGWIHKLFDNETRDTPLGDFEHVLREKFDGATVLVRSFDLVVFDNLGKSTQTEVDLLKVVRATGTDRRSCSTMWNVDGFDHDHDRDPCGKRPDEIIYAYLTRLERTPYVVSMSDGSGKVSDCTIDLAEQLTEHQGVIVYDPSKLHRKAPNEYWFTSDPLNAMLLLLTVRRED